MFAFHETTRKRTCRTAFFALCLAPTCATTAWIADHHLPWRQSAAARRLSDRYHLDVTLADWREPRPSMSRTAAVTLAEPGAADPLLKLTGVESHRRGGTRILSIDELSLQLDDLPALAARLEWSLARTVAAKIELHIETLALKPNGETAPITVHQLKGVVERDPQRHPRLWLLAHLDGKARLLPRRAAADRQTEPAAQQELRPPAITLSVETLAAPTNNESATPPALRQVITLDAQQNAIPIALLASVVPGAAALNDAATFTGVVTWQTSEKRYSSDIPSPASATEITGTLRGRLEGVDLACILPQSSAHRLQGTATVELTACQWRGQQFQQLAGTLTAANAAANGSFLAAAPNYLGCPPGEALKPLHAAAQRIAEQRRIGREPAAEDESLFAAIQELNHLACRFDLDAAGLAIEPLIPAASTLPAGTLAASKESPILFCPPLAPSAKLPAVAWLQFIAPPPTPWIPFTPATLETARRLPIPQ